MKQALFSSTPFFIFALGLTVVYDYSLKKKKIIYLLSQTFIIVRVKNETDKNLKKKKNQLPITKKELKGS